MELNMIVAAGRNGEIGRGGGLIWHISEDLKRFKRLTTGHPVIMGRKTWESLPRRPLPGRMNVVVSRQPGYEAPGAVVAASPEAALAVCSAQSGETPFVMGGAQIYESLFPYVGRIYLTSIDATCEDADARLSWPFPGEWEITGEQEEFISPEGRKYRFITLSRLPSSGI